MVLPISDAFLAAFSKQNILIIGDIILDHYLQGNVDRISPEAPVPIVNIKQESYRLGGAANVALNIKALGARPLLMSVRGMDKEAQQLIDLLEKAAIETYYILPDKERSTTCKTRVMSGHQQLLRYDKESLQKLSPSLEQQFIEILHTLLKSKSIDALIFQDYNKGMLTESLIQKTIELAKKYNITTFADPKSSNFFSYQQVDFFKPNLREIQAALANELSSNTNLLSLLQQATNSLFKHLSCQNIVITLGSHGMYWANAKGISNWQKGAVRKIADVCGAGDTVISVLASGISAGLSVEDCLRMANIAGGQVCEQVGVVPLNKDTLITEFDREM